MSEVMVQRRPAPKFHFGDYVRVARRELGLSQKQFAELVGVKTATVAAWEVGNSKPALPETAERLEEVTGFPKTYFLGWGDQPGPRSQANFGWRRRRGIIPTEAPAWRAPLLAAA